MTDVASTAFCVLRPDGDLDPYYLYSWVTSDTFIKLLLPLQRGNSPPAVLDADVRAQPIPIPPSLEEQRRVSANIEQLFDTTGDGQDALAAAKEATETFRQTLLKAAVSGGLTADWRAKNPEVETGEALLSRILDARRARWTAHRWNARKTYAEPRGAVTEDLPRLPPNWTWAALRQICDVGSGTTPSRKDARFWEGGDTPWLTSSCVNADEVYESDQFVSQEALAASRLKVYPPGTLLVALYGEGKTRGKSAILRFHSTINQALAAIRPDELVPVTWLKAVLDEGYQKNRADSAGGVQPNLNLGKIEGLPIPLGPPAEMAVALELLTKSLAERDNLCSELSALTSVAADLRQSILSTAFRGGLT